MIGRREFFEQFVASAFRKARGFPARQQGHNVIVGQMIQNFELQFIGHGLERCTHVGGDESPHRCAQAHALANASQRLIVPLEVLKDLAFARGFGVQEKQLVQSMADERVVAHAGAQLGGDAHAHGFA